MSLLRRTLHGVAWAYAVFFIERLSGFAISVVLARVLLPADFGLIAFALLIVGFLDAFRDLGVRDALTRTPGAIEPAASTAFWISLGLGLAQAAAMLLLAPLAQAVIEDARIREVMTALAVVPVLGALSAVPETLLMRALDFRKRFAGDLAIALAKLAIALALVVGGAGIWAIVVAQIASVTLRCISRWLLVRWRPRAAFDGAQARALIGFGWPLFLVGLIDIAVERIDQLVVGSLLGPAELGFYYIALRVPQVALIGWNLMLTRVTFPAFASVQDDLERLRQAVTATMRFAAYLLVPAAIGMAAVAPEVIAVLFGARWAPAAPIMALLACTALVESLFYSTGDAFKAIGRARVFIRIGLLTLALALVVSPLFAKLGGSALAVATGGLLRAAVVTAVWLAMLRQLFPNFRPVALLAPPLLAAAAMWAAIAAVRHLLAVHAPLVVLTATIVAGALVYAGVLWALAGAHISQGLRQAAAALRTRADA